MDRAPSSLIVLAVLACGCVTISAGVLLEEGSNGTVREQRVPRGTIPVFAPSMAMHDEIVRLALRRRGPARATVHVWSFPETSGLDSVSVTWRGDTARVMRSGGPDLHVRVDERGRILPLGTVDGEFRVVRTR